jgi:hypothetical protein
MPGVEPARVRIHAVLVEAIRDVVAFEEREPRVAPRVADADDVVRHGVLVRST